MYIYTPFESRWSQSNENVCYKIAAPRERPNFEDEKIVRSGKMEKINLNLMLKQVIKCLNKK